MHNLKLVLSTSRPVSWVNTAYPFAAGYFMLSRHVDPIFIIGSLYFLIPYNLLMYGINDVFDYESDLRNPRKGGIEGAMADKKYHPLIMYSAILSNIPFVLALLALGNLKANFAFISILFFVIAYSAPQLRFKERPFLDSITSSMHFVGPLLYAIALVNITSKVWPFVIAFFLWGMASHAFGAVQDILPDRHAKIASIATILGAKKTILLATFLYLGSSLLLLLQGGAAIAVGLIGLIYAVNTSRCLTFNDKTSAKANIYWRRFIWLNLMYGAVITVTLLYLLRQS